MNWEQTADHQWIREDGMILDLIPNTHKGMKRHTEFRLASIFNVKAFAPLTITFNAKERDNLLKFILKDIKTINFFSVGDWNRAEVNLNRARKTYFDFEEPTRGSYYGIKYVKYLEV
jgi:hypothetical protein